MPALAPSESWEEGGRRARGWLVGDGELEGDDAVLGDGVVREEVDGRWALAVGMDGELLVPELSGRS